MGRKPNPRGKDRTRTISLDGDVADIAQELADKSQLSKVLSQLLRNAYNLSDEITAMKERLTAMTDERKAMQAAEEELAQSITEAEQRVINDRNHILPSLYQRQGVIEERLKHVEKKLLHAITPSDRQRYAGLVAENERLLANVLAEIVELEQ